MDESPPTLFNLVLVDDATKIRSTTSAILRRAGFSVTEAGSADEALRILESRSDFDVLVTVMEMPGSMNGIALGHIVRERWPEIALLIISDLPSPASGKLPSGAAFLPRPATPEILVQAIRLFMGTTPAALRQKPS